MKHYEGQRLINRATGEKLQVKQVKDKLLICYIIKNDIYPTRPEFEMERFPVAGLVPVIRIVSKKTVKDNFIEY